MLLKRFSKYGLLQGRSGRVNLSAENGGTTPVSTFLHVYILVLYVYIGLYILGKRRTSTCSTSQSSGPLSAFRPGYKYCTVSVHTSWHLQLQMQDNTK